MTILRCPTCFNNGLRRNLAQVLPNGVIRIFRSIAGEREYTEIEGAQFSIRCGECQNMVFYKYPKVIDSQATRELILRNTFKFFGSFIGGTL